MNEWTDEQILEKVKTILSEALEVKPEVITLNSLIISDLGAESIDFLDISFRIEKVFNIKIPNQSSFQNPKDIPKGESIKDVFTVQIVFDFVKKKLEEAEGSALK